MANLVEFKDNFKVHNLIVIKNNIYPFIWIINFYYNSFYNKYILNLIYIYNRIFFFKWQIFV